MDGEMRSIKSLLYILSCLIIFTGCNMSHEPSFSLLLKKDLQGFPSASSIEFYKDKLYVIGDDARYLIILDKQYNVLDSVMLFPGEGLRIPKKEKADLEASTIIQYNGKDHLLVIGSGSTPEREDFYFFSLDDPRQYKKLNRHLFYHTMKEHGFLSINLEGMAAVNDRIVFANRANLSQPDNYFITTSTEFLYGDSASYGTISRLKFGVEDSLIKGISGMSYIADEDLLLFTASIEQTASAFEDGAIGDSYLGYITGFSAKTTMPSFTVDTLINLSAMYAVV